MLHVYSFFSGWTRTGAGIPNGGETAENAGTGAEAEVKKENEETKEMPPPRPRPRERQEPGSPEKNNVAENDSRGEEETVGKVLMDDGGSSPTPNDSEKSTSQAAKNGLSQKSSEEKENLEKTTTDQKQSPSNSEEMPPNENKDKIDDLEPMPDEKETGSALPKVDEKATETKDEPGTKAAVPGETDAPSNGTAKTDTANKTEPDIPSFR